MRPVDTVAIAPVSRPVPPRAAAPAATFASQLPSITSAQPTDAAAAAHRTAEIRRHLVAAVTSTPVHFEQPAAAARHPALRAYHAMVADPASINAAETDRLLADA